VKLNVGTRKGLFQFDLTGGRVEAAGHAHLGDPVTFTRFDARSGTLWSCMSLGHFGPKLRRSTDGGETWEETATPEYPEPGPEETDEDPIRGEVRPWTLGPIWSFEAGLADQPGRLWLGAMPGGLFRSDDNGESWELVRGLWDHPDRKKWFGGGADHPVIHSICVDPRDGRKVLVAVSCGGVWMTEDDGQTWECTSTGMRAEYMPPEQAYDLPIQDPHLVVRSAANPDRLWCQHHNGMYRSDDGGRSWVEFKDVEPSTFGFAVATHPEQPDTAWFVPAVSDQMRVTADGRMLVNRTRDGGASFQNLTAGLPEPPAWDIVFRHALDVGPRGQVLVLGSSTGSLWCSWDGGDSFELVSAHLPQIYSVELVS